MTIAFGLALYFMIWWMVLFAVLPFGVRTQGEAGNVTPGTPASAPEKPRLVRVFAINSVLAAVVFSGVWYVMESVEMNTNPPLPPGVTGEQK